MRIVVDSTDIGNLRINIPGKDSSVQVVQRSGSGHAHSTRLILDCTRLRVTVAGLLTIEFNLDFPPPPLILIPVLSATDMHIDYVRLATPTLIVPGLRASGDGRPAGKRVGYTPPGMNLNLSGPRAGKSLTPAQASQLTRLAALLSRPEVLRHYRTASP
jgi:hypothetical protein